jgi:hypothetical protein
MPIVTKQAAFAIAVAALLSAHGSSIVACGSSSPAPPGNTNKSASPPNLRQFESGAEAMSEAARGVLPAHVPDWPTAQAAYDADAQLWQQLKAPILAAKANMASISAIEAALAAYATDVARQNQRAAETDANKITLAVPDLFDLFIYPAPTDTLRLDGTFRQLQIGAEYSDWAECQTWLDDTKTVWSRLKPLVQAQVPMGLSVAGAVTVVADVDATLQTIQLLIIDKGAKSTDSADLDAQAQKGLDETDTCEQIFKSPTPDAGGCTGAHFVMDPKDGACKRDGTTTNVGAPCKGVAPGVCGTDQNASCLDQTLDDYPGGYCNVDPCTAVDFCPLGSSCVQLNGENGQCFKDCAMDSDCRAAEGYFCLDMTADSQRSVLWLSGASRKVCSRSQLTCPASPKDCPSVFPNCVLPDGTAAYPEGGASSATEAGVDDAGAALAPPTPICVK